jgi:hypothetical protein
MKLFLKKFQDLKYRLVLWLILGSQFSAILTNFLRKYRRSPIIYPNFLRKCFLNLNIDPRYTETSIFRGWNQLFQPLSWSIHCLYLPPHPWLTFQLSKEIESGILWKNRSLKLKLCKDIKRGNFAEKGKLQVTVLFHGKVNTAYAVNFVIAIDGFFLLNSNPEFVSGTA